MKRFILLLSYYFLYIGVTSLNSHSITLNPHTKVYNLKSENILIFEDRENKYKFDSLSASLFKPSDTSTPNFGFTNSGVWVKLALTNETNIPQNLVLEFSEPQVDYFQVYFPESDGTLKIYKAGDFEKFSIREIRYHNFLFPFSIKENSSKEIYLHFEPGYIIIPLKIYSEVGMVESASKARTIQGGFYGLMIVMIIYNLFLFFTIRDFSYLYYCLYITSYLGIQSNMSGLSYEYLWSNNPWWGNHSAAFFECATLFFASLFLRSFLNLKVFLPNSDKFLVYYNYLILIVCLISLLIPINLAMQICHVFVILLVPIVIYVTFRMLKKFKPARFFAIAWFFLVLGALLNVVRALGFIPQNFLTIYSVQIGSTLEVVLLSFALADRINQFKAEKENAQREAFEFQEKSKKDLELKVQERTGKLQSTLNLIQKDLNIAKKIQKGILPSYNWKKNLFEVKYIYQPMDEIGGDYYHIAELEDGRIRIILADATGHGIQAALVVMVIQGMYEPFKRGTKLPGEILTEMNKNFVDKYSQLNTFFTCVIIEINPLTKKLYYSSAGHPDMILLHKDNHDLLHRTGKLMGWFYSEYKTEVRDFSTDSRIYLFTDGIFEQFNLNLEEFGEDRLLKVLVEKQNTPLVKVVDEVDKQLKAFLDKSSIQDDITFIGIEIKK